MASRGVLIVAQHPREPFRLPTFLPTPSTTPFPHTPVCTSLALVLLPSTSPFALHPHSLSIHSPLNHHSPPPLLQQTTPARPLLDPLDETPSDIHRRVSSELIIKCIVVPAGLPFPTLQALFSPSSASHEVAHPLRRRSPPASFRPWPVARRASYGIFGRRPRDRRRFNVKASVKALSRHIWMAIVNFPKRTSRLISFSKSLFVNLPADKKLPYFLEQNMRIVY